MLIRLKFPPLLKFQNYETKFLPWTGRGGGVLDCVVREEHVADAGVAIVIGGVVGLHSD